MFVIFRFLQIFYGHKVKCLKIRNRILNVSSLNLYRRAKLLNIWIDRWLTFLLHLPRFQPHPKHVKKPVAVSAQAVARMAY